MPHYFMVFVLFLSRKVGETLSHWSMVPDFHATPQWNGWPMTSHPWIMQLNQLQFGAHPHLYYTSIFFLFIPYLVSQAKILLPTIQYRAGTNEQVSDGLSRQVWSSQTTAAEDRSHVWLGVLCGSCNSRQHSDAATYCWSTEGLSLFEQFWRPLIIFLVGDLNQTFEEMKAVKGYQACFLFQWRRLLIYTGWNLNHNKKKKIVQCRNFMFFWSVAQMLFSLYLSWIEYWMALHPSLRNF